MLNEVKHLYCKDASPALRMTVSVIIYIVALKYGRNRLFYNLFNYLVCSCNSYVIRDGCGNILQFKGYF